jgi:SOS-response transcriptional repressor LexA
MTKLQLKVYQFIINYINKEMISPTYLEISEACNINAVSNTYYVVSELIRKGYIVKLGRNQESRQLVPLGIQRFINNDNAKSIYH